MLVLPLLLFSFYCINHLTHSYICVVAAAVVIAGAAVSAIASTFIHFQPNILATAAMLVSPAIVIQTHSVKI
jgi:hypothetical protein